MQPMPTSLDSKRTKATFDVPAAAGGILTRILKKAGETAAVGEVIAYIQPAEAPAASALLRLQPRRGSIGAGCHWHNTGFRSCQQGAQHRAMSCRQLSG